MGKYLLSIHEAGFSLQHYISRLNNNNNQLSICFSDNVLKHHDQENFGEEGGYFSLQVTIHHEEGSPDMNLETGIETEAM